MGGRVLPDTTVAAGGVQPSAVPPFCVHSCQHSVCATTLCFAAPLCEDVGLCRNVELCFNCVLKSFRCCFFWFFMSVRSGSWTGAKRVKTDYYGLLWTNTSRVEIVLVQTDRCNIIWGAGAFSSLKSVCFECKQWTHTRTHPVGGHCCVFIRLQTWEPTVPIRQLASYFAVVKLKCSGSICFFW